MVLPETYSNWLCPTVLLWVAVWVRYIDLVSLLCLQAFLYPTNFRAGVTHFLVKEDSLSQKLASKPQIITAPPFFKMVPKIAI